MPLFLRENEIQTKQFSSAIVQNVPELVNNPLCALKLNLIYKIQLYKILYKLYYYFSKLIVEIDLYKHVNEKIANL